MLYLTLLYSVTTTVTLISFLEVTTTVTEEFERWNKHKKCSIAQQQKKKFPKTDAPKPATYALKQSEKAKKPITGAANHD